MSLSKFERQAVLTLKPYFSKDPVIFDIGSNKGFWSDILVENVHSAHLFEPNELLLHYTQVKYDHLSHVVYSPLGMFSEKKESDFHFFTNTNNGLSSVFYNHIWVDMGLPMQKGKIYLTTIDHYCEVMEIENIDFVKIDVEGADFDVLLGAKRMLSEGKIKFLQVEKSDHLRLSGHTWEEVLTHMSSLGYTCYNFNGDFVLHGEAENYYFMQEFTQDWNTEFRNNTKGLEMNLVLEIGAFEGLTTCYICENLLTKDGRVIVIDPLPDDENELPFGEDNNIFKGQYERFIRNTRGKPVELIRKKSEQVYGDEDFYHYRFDFIYIDGDHREEAVYNDGVFALQVLHVNGHILFDDYLYRDETKRGIDKFLRDYAHQVELVKSGYQVMVRKFKDV